MKKASSKASRGEEGEEEGLPHLAQRAEQYEITALKYEPPAEIL